VIGKDLEEHLKKNEPELDKAMVIFRWLHLIAYEEEGCPLACQGEEEMNDNHNEVTMTLAEGDYQLAPNLLPLGLWEMAQDYPRKLSG